MSWQEVQAVVESAAVARTEALLRLAGAVAVSFTSRAGEPLYEPPPGETPLWSSVTLRALFPPAVPLEAVAGHLRHALSPDVELTFRVVPDQEWERAGLRPPSVRRLGERLLLADAEADVPGTGRVVVRLNVGLAFGTGEHPTTQMCLRWLDAALPAGARVLDYGCGSGVLAVSALRLGARSAWAVDIEPQALTAARDNAQLNGVEDRLWVGTPDELPDVQADVVMANILAGTLAELAAPLSGHVRPGGHLVLSGILESQARDVRRHYDDRFGPFEIERADGWVLLSAPLR